MIRDRCLSAFATVIAVGGLVSACAAVAGELNLLCWEGYADQSFVKPFEQATGCQVAAAYVGTNDEFVAKVMGGGASYDLISPSNDTTMRLIDAGQIDPVDPAKVPHMKDLFPIFQAAPWLSKGGKIYGVPYAWGIIRTIVRADAVTGAKPDSLNFLWDPKNKGKLSIWDDVQAIYMTAHLLGFQNTYTLTDEQLAQIKTKLVELKPNIRKYWTTAGELGTLMASGEVIGGNAWEAAIVSLRKGGMKIIDIDPKEGSNGWADNWQIVKGASDNPCVYKWLDWVSTPKAQALAYGVLGYGSSNAKMVDELNPADQVEYKALKLDDPKILTAVDWWQSYPRRGRYLEVWNQVKAE